MSQMRHKPLAGHNISLTSHSSLGEQIGCRESNKREIDTVHGHRVFAGHGERGIKSTTKPSPHLCPDPSNIDYRQPVPRLVLLLMGKLIGDKGSLFQPLVEQLFNKQGIEFLTNVRK